ncbi:MAG TPA: hypothetical protein VJ850_00045 [Candidatus Limnocylindrales bacterium]|nr:hypothetical protein [Candidatus Limnocylindrales bacterium]
MTRVAGLLLAFAIAGCGWVQGGQRPHLGISNGTTLVVVLFVNGVEVGETRPEGPTPVIDATGLPPLPWVVEARTVSGRVLTSMKVVEGQVWTTTRPDGGISSSGAIGRVDLTCGRLTIWAGDAQPLGPPPAPNAGQPGDCAP